MADWGKAHTGLAHAVEGQQCPWPFTKLLVGESATLKYETALQSLRLTFTV